MGDLMVSTDEIAKHLSADAVQNVHKWLNNKKYAKYQSELVDLIDSEKWEDIEDAFFTEITFGTAGIRGKTGLGSARINLVTMGEAAQGLAAYVKEAYPEDGASKGIAIAYDTRLTSVEFSNYVAEVIAANGVKVYLFNGYRSTPELSFAVRHLGCAAGVVVSASHNPPADNGFKAYWSDGGQVSSPHDKEIVKHAHAVEEIQSLQLEDAIKNGSVVMIGGEVDKAYIETVASESLSGNRTVDIVFSPLHGAGTKNTLEVLQHLDFAVDVVESQMTPDGHFPTIPDHKPNPELSSANELAIQQMLASKSDIAITNDPDADRFAVNVRRGDSSIQLTGSQSGALATEYVLSSMHKDGGLNDSQFVAKTLVTTDLIPTIAKAYNVESVSNLLVGFKYFARTILEHEDDKQFLIGVEESYGLLKGTYACDKDGASGALMLAEYAAQLKADGKTLYDALLDLFVKHGVFVETMNDVYFYGAEGFRKMQEVMATLKSDPIDEIAGHTVSRVYNHENGMVKHLESGDESSFEYSSANMVVYECGDEFKTRVTVRPSGTEPKIKLYVQWYESPNDVTEKNVEEKYLALKEQAQSIGKALEGKLLEL